MRTSPGAGGGGAGIGNGLGSISNTQAGSANSPRAAAARIGAASCASSILTTPSFSRAPAPAQR